MIIPEIWCLSNRSGQNKEQKTLGEREIIMSNLTKISGLQVHEFSE